MVGVTTYPGPGLRPHQHWMFQMVWRHGDSWSLMVQELRVKVSLGDSKTVRVDGKTFEETSPNPAHVAAIGWNSPTGVACTLLGRKVPLKKLQKIALDLKEW